MSRSEPDNVAWFVRQLEEKGFAPTLEQSGSMDSALRVFRRGTLEVRLVKERSQWSVDLREDSWPAGGSDTQRLVFPLFHGFAIE